MPDTTTTQDVAEFSAVLLDLDKGRVHDDAGTRLAELVSAVVQTGGKGKVVLTIEVEPLDPETFAETDILAVTGKVDATIPRAKRATGIFYADGTGGRLTRSDPHRADPLGDR